MAFTGRIGTIDSRPGNTVPMFGAGGIKRSQDLSGQLTSSGLLASTHFFVFQQVSVTFYRALNRVVKFVTIFRTN